MADQQQRIDVGRIVPSPTNPRKTFDPVKMQELADSILNKGLVQPIVVRPRKGQRFEVSKFFHEQHWLVFTPDHSIEYHAYDAAAAKDLAAVLKKDHFELVAGERRWRAHLLAKLPRIDALVRDLSDKDVAELQVIENEQREDVPVLEKAAGYEQLMKKHGYTAEGVAGKIGKSTATVYGLLKLLHNLPDNAMEAMKEGRLPVATAQLIARIPCEKDRSIAASQILHSPRMPAGEPLSYRGAKELIENNFTRELKGAPFDRKALDLVPAAGACGPCPKRAGNMGESNGRADVCTDVSCYRQKLEAHRDKLFAFAEAQGVPALRDPCAEKWFGADGKLDPFRGWVDLDDTFDTGKRGKKPTYRQLCRAKKVSGILGPGGCAVAVIDNKSELRTIAPEARVKGALEAAGLLKREVHEVDGVTFGGAADRAEERGPTQYAIKNEAGVVLAERVGLTMEAIHTTNRGALVLSDGPLAALRAATWALAIKGIGTEAETILQAHMGRYEPEEDFEKKVEAWVDGAAPPLLLRLIVELSVLEVAGGYGDEYTRLRERCATLGGTSWPGCLDAAKERLARPPSPAPGGPDPGDEQPEEADEEEPGESESDFDQWVREVRDPAEAAQERLRVLSSGCAVASYRVAPLPDGRWALQMDLNWTAGNLTGLGSPWEAYADRLACLEAFHKAALERFGKPRSDEAKAQAKDRPKFLALLKGWKDKELTKAKVGASC